MSWLKRNASTVEAGAAAVTALVAILALVGVKMQIDASRAQTQAQTARDLYREYLTLSIQYPQFAHPAACPAWTAKDATAYEGYVDYLLYTAEQTIEMDPSWQPVMEDALAAHSTAVCQLDAQDSYTDAVARMIAKLHVGLCRAEKPVCD